jgi:ATP-dependent DNA ligase
MHGIISSGTRSTGAVPRPALSRYATRWRNRSRRRISFNLLQHHRSQAHALLFYAFDVLIYRGINLLNESLSRRREVLSDVMKPLRRKTTANLAFREYQPNACRTS